MFNCFISWIVVQLFVKIYTTYQYTTYFHMTYHCQILLNISDISYSGFTLTNAMPNNLHSFTRHCNLFRDCNIFAKTRLANLIGSCQDIIPLSFCRIKISKYFVGIFAYLNYLVPRDRKFIIDTLIKGLQRLEYRGYDSTGMFY